MVLDLSLMGQGGMNGNGMDKWNGMDLETGNWIDEEVRENYEAICFGKYRIPESI